MAASSASSNIRLKLLVNKKAQKVLFAEAGKEFVDFLFQIFSLPVGTVIKVLKKHSMVGSLQNIYDSIENLSDAYMQPNQSKDSILNPKIANYGTHVPLLLPDDDVSMARKYYRCRSHFYVADDSTAVCLQCNSRMDTELPYVAGHGAVKLTAEGGGFVKAVVTYMIMDDLEVMPIKAVVTYMIMDDLEVMPMSTISGITMLNKFHVKEIGDLEEKVVFLGMKEGLMLLKASFECKNVLTTVFMA